MTEHGRPDPKDPKRVVVIGARGFVGADLTSRLAAGGTDAMPLSSQDIDLCDAGAGAELDSRLEADDVVVLVSALTPDKGKDIRTLMRNLTMGEQACQALAEGRVAQVVYVSSDAVYADDANPVREDSCCHPSSYHGLMHLTRETMLREICKGADTPLFIVRPSLLYGALDTIPLTGVRRDPHQCSAADRHGRFAPGRSRLVGCPRRLGGSGGSFLGRRLAMRSWKRIGSWATASSSPR